MRKALALFLCVALMISLLAAPAVSGAEAILYGDADGDGRRFAAGTSQATVEAWLKDLGY